VTAYAEAEAEVLGTVRAMACDVTLYGRSSGHGGAAVSQALEVFRVVHETCTRFDDASPLMAVNAAPDRWHAVPRLLWVAVGAAYAAYLETEGRFDPRVLADLRRLGYDRSLPTGGAGAAIGSVPAGRQPLGRWRPQFRSGPTPSLHLDGAPVDLGGIGKGLAVRWAAERLAGHLDSFVLDAGGDGVCRGPGPDGDGWPVGVEHPGDPGRPVAVLGLSDLAYATSSIRLRRWAAGGEVVHHLIDPRSGLPGGRGLASVTVVGADTADAEVRTKALFLVGADRIATEAARHGVAALWIGADGAVGASAAMEPHLRWRGW
jgi:thiamine biosynthesis lipoprotein